jgi:hypothetical protein
MGRQQGEERVPFSVRGQRQREGCDRVRVVWLTQTTYLLRFEFNFIAFLNGSALGARRSLERDGLDCVVA